MGETTADAHKQENKATPRSNQTQHLVDFVTPFPQGTDWKFVGSCLSHAHAHAHNPTGTASRTSQDLVPAPKVEAKHRGKMCELNAQ